MKIILNVDICLSKDKGKHIILFETIDEILKYYKPDEEMVEVITSAQKEGCIGFVKSFSFEDDQSFVQMYKKNSKLDKYNVIFDDVRVYNGFILPFKNETDFRFKMMAIDNGNKEGLIELKDFI